MLRRLTAALAALMFLGLCACQPIPEPDPEEPDYQPVTVFGVTFSEAPQTIVTLSPASTEMLARLGLTEQIVGRGEGCTYPEEMEGVTTVGTESEPDMDALLALEPDVVIIQRPLSISQLERLNEAEVKALIVPAATDLRELKSYYTSVGSIFYGLDQAAERANEILRLPFQQANAMLEVLGEQKQSFVYFSILKETAAMPDTFAGSLLGYLGGNAAVAGDDGKADLTAVEAADPYLVFVPQPYALENLNTDEFYANYTAVAEGRVYALDAALFERQSVEAFSAVFELAKTIYPEQAEALDASVEAQAQKLLEAAESGENLETSSDE